MNVTATRAERDVLDVPGNVTVIEREDIEKSGVTHVAELLRREAGIFVSNDIGNVEGYRVEARGFNNGGGNGSGLLVLVDGRRVNEPDGSTTDWARMPLDSIERVEIVRGPASAVWGDNAGSGVIQIITRRGEGAPHAVLHGRAGTFDLEEGSLFAGGSADRVDVTLFAEGYSEDGFRERSDYRRQSFDGKLRVQVTERVAAEVASGYTSDHRKRPGSLTQQQIDTLGRDAADPSNDRNREDSRVRYVQALLEAALAEDVVLSVTPFYTKRDKDAGLGSADPISSFTFVTDTDTRAKGLNTQLRIDLPLLGRRNRLQLGGDWLKEEVESESLFELAFMGVPQPPTLGDTRVRRRLYGIFLQEELNLSDDLLLSAGLRFDHARYRARDFVASQNFSETFDLWSPKVGITYRVAEGASAYVSFTRGFRFPNFDEVFGFFGFTPGLDPERSQSYEVGFKVRRKRWSSNVAVYHMDVRDEIFFNSELTDSGFPAPRNVNMERVRHQGVELSLSVFPATCLELYGSYTYDDTRIRHDSLTDLDPHRVPLTPRHRGTLGVNLITPWWSQIGLNANYVGSRILVNDLENELDELSKYATYDAVLRIEPPLGEAVQLSFTAAVRNLFDREYSEVAGERTFSPGLVGFFPAPGRHYELGVRIEWVR